MSVSPQEPLASTPTVSGAHQAGTASGVLNTFRRMGGSFGVAIYGGTVAAEASLLHGPRISPSATALLTVVTAVVTLTLCRTPTY
ncbi:MAG: hypothetical protein ACM3ML_17705 [Micromonosporaceae bacterium]